MGRRFGDAGQTREAAYARFCPPRPLVSEYVITAICMRRRRFGGDLKGGGAL